jgi:hypothetical protein
MSDFDSGGEDPVGDAWAEAEANSQSSSTPPAEEAAPAPAANDGGGDTANAATNANGISGFTGTYKTGADANNTGLTPPPTPAMPGIPPQIPQDPAGPRATPGPDLNQQIPDIPGNMPSAPPSGFGAVKQTAKDLATGNLNVGDYNVKAGPVGSTSKDHDPNIASEGEVPSPAAAPPIPNTGAPPPGPPKYWSR